MTRGTTPTYTFELEDESIDLSDAEEVYVTISQGRKKLTKSGGDVTVDGNTASIYLSQEDTLGFAAGQRAEFQLNWIYSDGARACSEIVSLVVGRNLLPEVLP